jgi:hypothetical protein
MSDSGVRKLLAGATGIMAFVFVGACSGRLGLQFGETLCDNVHSCRDGFVCFNSVCVVATGDGLSADGATVGDQDQPLGDWPGAIGDPGEIISSKFCRVDAQCARGEACVSNECVQGPCTDVTCPSHGTCSYTCLPTGRACEHSQCDQNLEGCVAGMCLPSCVAKDPCIEPGCSEADDPVNCSSGLCLNNTVCVGGVCREVIECDGRFCPQGFVCSLACGAPNPCDPNPCNIGWSCQVTGDQALCVENPCSGLRCNKGQICLAGQCIDPCESVPCEEGGRLCPQTDEVCCHDVCCAPGLLCREGQCLKPEGFCDPQCKSGEICIESECYCDEIPPRFCAALQCCIEGTCTDVCHPNPCAAEAVNRMCIKDCGAASGYQCVDGCESVVCELPATTCDSEDGVCKCGPQEQVCGGGQCCLDSQCTSPCQPNPCAGNPQNRGCVRDCTNTPLAYNCIDLCATTTCDNPPYTVCDPNDGVCKCGISNQICAANQCCVTSGPDKICKDPCSPDPCWPGGQCIRDCTVVTGFTCKDNCPTTGNICPAISQRNPDCRGADNQCWCAAASAVCGLTQCCSGNQCLNPCSPVNPCPGGAECIIDCTQPSKYRCLNHCLPTDPCLSNAVNTDCNPATGSCQCHNTTFDTWTWCNGVSNCCESGVCLNPCWTGTPLANPCNVLPNYKCTVACSRTGPDYVCSDPCPAVNCSQATSGRNPDCVPRTSGSYYQCVCNAAGGATCSSPDQCCGGSSCATPCSPNLCSLPNSRCTVDCSVAGDRTCTDPCSPNPCVQPTPACSGRSDGGTDCKCGVSSSCSSPNCCVGNSCVDPCATFPCTGGEECVRDCAQPQGRTCVNHCSGFACPAQNPLCDPADANPATRCHCGNFSTLCTGATCCMSNACADPCAGDPCASDPTNKKCVVDCAQTSGFRCEDYCAGVSCAPPLGCNHVTGICGCGSTYGICTPGSQLCCLGGPDYACTAIQCTDAGCAAQGKLCNKCTGCYGGGGG